MIKILFLSFIFISQAFCLNIALASNLSYVMPTLIKEFNKEYPKTKVKLSISSSGKLSSQIQNSAPYDIFMSADMKYPDFLYKKNLTLFKAKIYAKGSLVLFSSKKRDFSQKLDILRNKDIKRIALANPKTAPYGKVSKEVLKNAKLLKELKHKLIYAGSISQAVTYTLNAAEIGFIAKSSLFAPSMLKYKEGQNYLNIDKNLYESINQGIVILKNSKHKKEAKEFYDFILSLKAKKILENFGYLVP